MKYIVISIIIAIIIVPMACQNDPADEFATEDIYFDNPYHLNGAPWLIGGGNVGAAANLDDNAIIRGDGGLVGIQDSSATISDAGVLTVDNDITNVAAGADINSGNDLNCVNDLDVGDDADIHGDLNVTGTINGVDAPELLPSKIMIGPD